MSRALPVLLWATLILLAGPAFAGGRPSLSTRPSAFLPETMILNSEGQRIGVIRPSPFLPGVSSVFTQPGNERIIQIEPSLVPDTQNIILLQELIGHD